MKATLPNLKNLAGRARTEKSANSENDQHQNIEPTKAAPEPKPPPALCLFFMLSHLEDDGPVRLDGVKLAVLEVLGLELDEPKLGTFAGSLNALDFPVQLLVRQHPPVLEELRSNLEAAQPEDLPQQTRDAAESLGRLLTGLETREGILDRRFYAICEHSRADELRGLLSRAGLGVFPLKGQPLKLLLLASALGGSPNATARDEDAELAVEINRRDIRVGGHLTRSLHLGKWPRLLAPGFLQGLMAAGAPMDLSVHLGAVPSEQAARTLEWQKVRFESAQSLSLNRGRSLSPRGGDRPGGHFPAQGRGAAGPGKRLFHASLSVTLHADNAETLKDLTQKARAHFAATLGKLDNLAFRQREGLLSTLPLGLNAVAVWRTLDTSSLARLFPFSPPDLDTRSGTLYGIDLRACAPVVYDPFDGTHLNANTAVLARSGSGENPSPPSWECCAASVGGAGLRHRPGGRVRRHGPRRRWEGAVPWNRGPGHEPLRHRPGRLGRTLAAHRQPAPPDRGDGGGAAERRAAVVFGPCPGRLLRRAPGAHRLPGFLRLPGSRRRRRHSPPAAALRHRQPAAPPLRRGRRPADPRGPGHRLRPAPAGAGASARRRDGLHRNGVGGGGPGPPAKTAGGGRGVEHHGSTPRARPSWSRWPNAPASIGWVSSSSPRTSRTCSPRTPPGPSPGIPAGRCCRTRPSSCCLQQDAAAISTVGEAFDLPVELQRWLLSCPRGDGLLLARGNRFPIRIEATPEETEVIEWRPGPRH